MAKRKKKNNHPHGLQIYVDADLRRRIRKSAAEEGLSESAYCRRILMNMVPGAVE